MAWVGGDTLDDQLPVRDADRKRAAVIEEDRQATHDVLHRRRQRRMTGRIHGESVNTDGELDQELGECPRQRRLLLLLEEVGLGHSDSLRSTGSGARASRPALPPNPTVTVSAVTAAHSATSDGTCGR